VTLIKQALWAFRLRANPIMVKELRSRMRGIRAFAILTGVLVLLAGVSYLFYRIVLAATRYSNSPVGPQIGYTLLVALMSVEMLIVCFVTPAVTAGAISGEKEKLTYEMLLTTPLRPASILWGKLLSALGYVFLLLLASIPMASLVFVYGGVTLTDMIKALAILTATAVTLGVVGVTLSAWLGRTVRATVLSYLFVLILLIGPLLVWIMIGVLRNQLPPSWILIPNPVSALFSAFAPATSYGGSSVLFELSRVLGGVAVEGGEPGKFLLPRPLYHYTLPFYGLLSFSFYLLATRLVRPTRRWRIRRREALLALVALLVLAAVVAIPFLATLDRYERRIQLATPTPVSRPVPPMMGPAVPEPMIREVTIAEPMIESEPTPTSTPVDGEAP
jgi:ABC-type transport system involved in multi-copper enzyme maturation permease subunit